MSRYACGRYMNALQLARSVVSNPAGDSVMDFVEANLFDDRSSLIWRPTGLSVDPWVTMDMDRLGGYGAFDSFPNGAAAAPAGWTADDGAGSVGQEVALAHGGGSAVKLTNAKAIVLDYVARTGERLNLDGFLRGDAAATARVRVVDLRTGKSLRPDGTWQAAAIDAGTQLAAAWAAVAFEFRVDGWDVHQQDATTLRITIYNDGSVAGTVYADDWSVYPSINCVTIAGHNIEPQSAVQLRSSTDAFVGNDVHENTFVFAMKQPAFYAYVATAIKKRWLRLKVVGTQTTTLYIAELVLTYVETAPRHPNWSFTTAHVHDQVRNESTSGELTIHPRAQQPRRAIHLKFRPRNAGQYEAFRDDIVRRSKGGLYPILFIPMDDEAEVILGRISNAWEVTREFVNIWTNDLTIGENPFPTVTAPSATDGTVYWLLGVPGATELGITTRLWPV